MNTLSIARSSLIAGQITFGAGHHILVSTIRQLCNYPLSIIIPHQIEKINNHSFSKTVLFYLSGAYYNCAHSTENNRSVSRFR